MPDLTPEEILLAQQIAYRKSLVRGSNRQDPPPYNAEAAVGDFLEAAGEVSARRTPGITSGLEFSGWSIIHRTLAEYDQHFPQYAQRAQAALEHEFPGALVISEHFQQSAEEPIVIAPPGTQSQIVADARSKARLAYDGVARSLVIAPSPPSSSGPNPPGNPLPATPPQPTVNPNDVQGTWLVIVPMFQLEVSDDTPINGRWNVGDVSFVSRAQLIATLNPPTLTNIPRQAVFQTITGEDNSFAIITLIGTPNELRRISVSSTSRSSNHFGINRRVLRQTTSCVRIHAERLSRLHSEARSLHPDRRDSLLWQLEPTGIPAPIRPRRRLAPSDHSVGDYRPVRSDRRQHLEC